MHFVHMLLAIVFEVLGTSLLKYADGFTKLWPTLGTVASYAATFFFLGLALKVIPMGPAYAIWSGLGIVLITLIGLFVFNQKLDFWAIVGLGLIMAGVVVINLLSRTVPH